MSDQLNLYKIPATDTNLPQDVDNPGNLNVGGAAIDNSTSGGLTEQKVRDIINSVKNNMTEPKVREIVNSMQKFLTGQNIMVDGIQKSQNFYTGLSGWQIDAEGNAEFNNGTFRGTFNIGGTTITIGPTQDIQTYIDIIDTAGGGTLFLQNGTYTLTADLLIPSGVTLQGVSRDGVIIDDNTLYKVCIIGSNGYNTGTISITGGTTAVVGVGTTFTSAMVGRFILLDGLWYEIITFTDTTHITIGTDFTGTTLAASTYTIATVNFGATLRNITVTNATGSGVKLQYAQEAVLDNLYVSDCGIGIDCDQVVFPLLKLTSNFNGINVDFNNTYGFEIQFSDFSFSTTGSGFNLLNSGSATVLDSATGGNFDDGISLTGCSNIAFVSMDSSGNGGQGIEFVSGNSDCQLIAFTVDGNTSDGIKLTATSDRISLSTCSILNNGGYGVNIAASTCDDNNIIAPAFSNNALGTINDQGTNTFISPQEFERTLVLIASIFETSGRFTNVLTGGGSITFGVTGAAIATSATATSSVNCEYTEIKVPDADSSSFSTYVSSTATLGTDSQSFFGLGLPTITGAGITYVNKHIGFKIVRVASGAVNVYATQADGATENASSVLTTITTNDALELTLKVNGTSSVDYYWRLNGGARSSPTNLTSNMPLGIGSGISFQVSNAGVASATTYNVGTFSYQR